MSGRALMAAGVLALAALPARAEDTRLQVFPVNGLFGPEVSACGTSGRTDTLVATTLCDKVAPLERRQYWGHRFSTLLGDRLSGVRMVSDLTVPPPSGLTRETMASRTLVASVHVSRADLWTVPKASVVEAHMPITLTLLMTNVLTGEIMFSHTVSTNVQGLMPADSWQVEASGQFDTHFDAALVRLVDEAANRFRPTAITTQVRGRHGDLYIVDAGLHKGLRPGDQIGADATVEFADTDYALVRPALDTLHTGQTLERHVAQPADVLRSPSLLVVIAGTTADFPKGYASVVMQEALTAAGGFSLLQINPAASIIRTPQLTASGVESRPPALPDYFLRTTVAPLEPVLMATNVPGVERRVQEARVFLEVISHDGRVIFATEGKDQQVDEISHGMAPSTAQRRDVAVRNAMLRAARSLREDFTPARVRLPIASGNDREVTITDTTGVLGMGHNAHVVRSIGRVSGIAGEVWVPVAELEVVDFGNGVATARQSGVETTRVRRGDQVAHDSVSGLSGSRYLYAPCLDDRGQPSVVVRGINQPLYGTIAFNRFARHFPGAVQVANFPQEAAYLGLTSVSPGYRAVPALTPGAADYCFEPVHNLVHTGQRPSSRSFAQNTYDLTAGFILKKDGQRVGAQGLQQSITATAVPIDTTPAMQDNALQIDLSDFAASIAQRAAGSLNPNPNPNP